MAYNILINDSIPDRITSYFDKKWVIHNWRQLESGDPVYQKIEGFLIYGHPIMDGKVMGDMPGLKGISNFGVGVDHIDLDAAKVRGISVGNTPNLLDGADMAFAVLLAIARNLVKSDRYAHSPSFVRHDPSILHG